MNPITSPICRDEPSLGLMSIATGPYLEYWKELMYSADRYLFGGRILFATVFTDRSRDARAFARCLRRLQINVVHLDNLPWPEITLQRYEVFSANWDRIEGDFLIYLDADMRINRRIGEELWRDLDTSGIGLVPHPGFYRGPHPMMFRYKNISVWLSDIKRWLLLERGIGQWERRGIGAAYVEPRKRKVYVCGGVWVGWRPQLQDLVDTLAENTRKDRAQGLVARWHDESHLNWWAAHNDFHALSPAYCVDERVMRRVVDEPIIFAVDKAVRVR